MLKNFNNLLKAGTFVNNARELYEWTMSNLDDAAKFIGFGDDGVMEFKAVCLSGVQDQDANAAEKKGYMEIIIRPLGPAPLSPNCLPDPRDFKEAAIINKAIALHGSVFKARSSFDFKDHSAIKFGQVVVCKYHKDPYRGGLRFDEPTGILLIQEYLDLAAIEGVAAGSLFTPPGAWPAGMQAIINGVTAMVQQLQDFMSMGGGGGGGVLGAGKAYQGGNNTKHPRDEGLTPDSAAAIGLNYNTHGPKKNADSFYIALHCW